MALTDFPRKPCCLHSLHYFVAGASYLGKISCDKDFFPCRVAPSTISSLKAHLSKKSTLLATAGLQGQSEEDCKREVEYDPAER